METTRIRAVEMVRQIRDAQYEQLQSMTTEERIAFYRQKAQRFWTRLEAGSQAEPARQELLASNRTG